MHSVNLSPVNASKFKGANKLTSRLIWNQQAVAQVYMYKIPQNQSRYSNVGNAMCNLLSHMNLFTYRLAGTYDETSLNIKSISCNVQSQTFTYMLRS